MTARYKTSSPPPSLDDVDRVLRLPSEVQRVLKLPEIGTAADVPESKKPKTLLELYLNGDVSKILRDTVDRPEHYTEEQRELAAALYSNPGVATSPQAVDELLLTWMRPTAAVPTPTHMTKPRNRTAEVPDPLEDNARLVFGDEVVDFKI